MDQMKPKSKKRRAPADINKPAKKPVILDELVTKIATFGKLVGKGPGWKKKAQELGSLVNIQLDLNNSSKDQIIQILAHAHIK